MAAAPVALSSFSAPLIGSRAIAAGALDEAKSQIARLAAISPGEYFLFNIRNGSIIEAGLPARV